MRDHEDAIGRLVGPDERLGIFERERDRLLEQDVLASGERRLGHLPVLRGGQADIDRLDAGIGENRLQIIRPTRADLARQGVAAIGARGVDRRHRDVRHRGVRFGVRAPHEPRAQDRDLDHCPVSHSLSAVGCRLLA